MKSISAYEKECQEAFFRMLAMTWPHAGNGGFTWSSVEMMLHGVSMASPMYSQIKDDARFLGQIAGFHANRDVGL